MSADRTSSSVSPGGERAPNPRVSELTASQSRLLVGADAARRHLTQDIDAGVRRRLVSALINLRRADQCLDDEPDRARELIREALGYANVGPDELRGLAAGVHPAVLTTHGLAAAVSALAQTSAVPLTLDISPSRCAQPVEAAAYSLIAEALSNATSHTNATRVHVVAYRAGTDLIVEVCDDGVGGAGPTGGSALRGHVEAIDGTLEILSQPGIGTRIRASFPHADDAVRS